MARTRALGFALTLAAGVLGAVPAAAQNPTLVISQVYGGGSSNGALFQHDFVEIHNVGQAPVGLDGLSIQFAPPFGLTIFAENPVTLLSGTVPAGGYHLVRFDGDTEGAPLPAADSVGSGDLSAFSGKIVLVNSPDPLSCNGGSSPCDGFTLARIIDLVGYGSSDFFEGPNGAVQGTSPTTAALRAGAGCTDTNDTLADFSAVAPAPRNSASATVTCAAPPPPPPPPPPPACVPTATIAAIQGSGPISPVAFAPASTSGVVTARYTAGPVKGFFLQMLGGGDGDPSTSDGLFVSTGAIDPPADAAVGNEVCVEGTVEESVPADDVMARPITDLLASRVVLVGTGRPLPAPVSISASAAGPGAALDALERFEGMRVRFASLAVVAPTRGLVSVATASAASTGVFYAVASGVARPVREPGIDVHDGRPLDAPPDVPLFDANLERVRVDSAGLGLAPLNVATGATVTSVVGPLHYADRTPTVLAESVGGVTGSSATAVGAAVPAPRASEFTVATLYADRLFDTTDSVAHDDGVATTAALARRLAKLSLQIRTVLRLPDFLAVQDVETLALLQALAARVNADAVAAGLPDPGYQGYLIEGQDLSGLDSGVLVKSSRVTLTQIVQLGLSATFYDPWTGSTLPLNDRPPLLARATVGLATGPVPVNVVVTHLHSGQRSADIYDGLTVRTKRAAQAEFLAGMVGDLQAASPSDPLVVLGDFGGVQLNDGWVDVVGTAAGTPIDAAHVVVPTTDLVDPDLADALADLPAAQRYTSTDGGNAQELHHVLVNGAAAGLQSRAAIAHANADFPDTLLGDAARAERAAGADVPVVYFEVAPAPQPPPAGPKEITGQVRVKVWRSHYFWHHRGVTFALVDVTNLTRQTINGPFVLGIGGLPAGATVTNARGTVAGLPAVPVFWWHQLRPGRTMRAWVVLKGVPISTTPTIRVFVGKAK